MIRQCSVCGERFSAGPRRRRCDACRKPHDVIKGKQWDQLRLRVLFEEPACYLCGRPSTQVDHVEPLTLRPDLAFERSNLRGICASCNSRKSDRVDGKHYLPETATPRRGVEL